MVETVEEVANVTFLPLPEAFSGIAFSKGDNAGEMANIHRFQARDWGRKATGQYAVSRRNHFIKQGTDVPGP